METIPLLKVGSTVVKETTKATAPAVVKVAQKSSDLITKYDPSLAITGTGVATGMSAYTNYDKYNGAQYAGHVVIDGTVSFLTSKFLPTYEGIKGVVVSTGGNAFSGLAGEGIHQLQDNIVQNKSYDGSAIGIKTAVGGLSGGLGATAKEVGAKMGLPANTNNILNLGTSTATEPALKYFQIIPKD